MNKQLFGKGKQKRNTLRKTVRALTEKLSDPKVSADERAKILNEIEQMERIRNGKTETASTVVKVVGTLGIMAAAAVWGHKMEQSDQIVQNKNSFNLFGRIAKL